MAKGRNLNVCLGMLGIAGQIHGTMIPLENENLQFFPFFCSIVLDLFANH